MSHNTLKPKFLRTLNLVQRVLPSSGWHPIGSLPTIESLGRIAASVLVGVLLLLATESVALDAAGVWHFLSATKAYEGTEAQPRAAQPVVVPSLIGYSGGQAYGVLHSAGLRPRIELRVDLEKAPDVVLAQTTGPVAPGSIVTLLVNAPQSRGLVPAVKGLTEPEAQALLARSGLATDTVSVQYSPQVPEAHVVKELPPAGAALPRHSTVQLVLSAGAPQVPRLLGLSYGAAERETAKLGLKLQVDGPADASKRATIIGQDPEPAPGLLATTPLIRVRVGSQSTLDDGGLEETTPHAYTNTAR